MWRKIIGVIVFSSLVQAGFSQETAAGAPGGTGKTLYENSFEKAEAGSFPEEFFKLDGEFAVQKDEAGRFLELPGAPLDSFGLLFGPSEREGVLVGARVFGTAKGRRYPTMAIGSNGYGGYRLQVSPGKKLLEIYKGDQVQTSVPYEWVSGKWVQLRLMIRKTEPAVWEISGKAWTDGAPEPKGWALTWKDKEEPPAGRASIWGSPFATTPIRFDDLRVSKAP